MSSSFKGGTDWLKNRVASDLTKQLNPDCLQQYFLHLRLAFDSVPHRSLPDKLKSIG